MPVKPLNSDMSNKAAFVNSLFDSDVRDPMNVLGDISNGALIHSFTDSESQSLILNAWLAAWQEGAGEKEKADPDALARCPTQDKAWFYLMANYILVNRLSLCIPLISFDHINSDGQVVYRTSGYQRIAFHNENGWQYGAIDSEGRVVGEQNESVVCSFLTLLFHGAHFVIIQSDADGGAGVTDLRDFMTNHLATRVDLMSSHYGFSAIGSGRYYTPAGSPAPSLNQVDVESLAESTPPGNEPLLFSALVGVTAKTRRNEFLQLEGWPAQTCVSPPGGERHNSDFDINDKTFWNISTFGACAFSEKRSTPIFLAPDTFNLNLHPDTGMPYYWGANAGNAGDSWLHPHLIVSS